jgi:predicted RNA-binding Zn ribbon-like protein
MPHEESFLKEEAIILKLAGFNNKQIGDAINISREQVSDWLNEPEQISKFAKLTQAIPAAARQLLQTYSVEAVAAIVDVMRHSEDDKFILEAAKEVLDRTGLPKATRQEIQSEKTERVEFGADESQLVELRQLPPELQEEAAQAMEELQDHLKQLSERAKDANESAGTD